MKNLPIGIQTLTEIRELNGIYVDKTKILHKLIATGKYYFLSRPRRAGKSLLISTFKELFKGNKTVFKDLWIEPHWDWAQTSPVIHLSFDAMDYQTQSLGDALTNALNHHAKDYGIRLKTKGFKQRFEELLIALSKKHGRVVLLIDEYDKPIIDYLESTKIEQAKANRDTLRDFYGILKNSDAHLRFVFITGISKFSKVSLFSHLNNLEDITIGRSFAALTGYTQEELESYFAEHLEAAAKTLNISLEELLEQMKIWYNGYSWDGEVRVYNPFGTLNFLKKQEFHNYWMATGNPRFLMEQMKKQTHFNVENISVNSIIFEKFDIENIEIISLMFQTGYLTIKERDPRPSHYILDYPNKEVRESMYQFLMDDLAPSIYRKDTGRVMLDLNEAFLTKNLKKVRKILESILADLPVEAYMKQTEGLYHGLVHILFNYLGVFIQSEVHSSQGHADSVVETPTDVFLFEFKFNKTADAALIQIEENDYAGKYRASGKAITAIGVNFNAEVRGIDDWKEKMI
ncbi:MAG: AAA family ATPase [Saprospiraceae bacterium]|nr:AAA family ATPase [Saprospiraceae bacterium]